MDQNDSFVRRKRHLRNLVVMALADGQLGQREVDIVAQRCVDLGLSDLELKEAIRFGLGDDAALELPATGADREDLMKDLIRVMAADGRVDEGEKRLFALAAAYMNLTTGQIDRLIAEVTRDRNAGVDDDDEARRIV